MIVKPINEDELMTMFIEASLEEYFSKFLVEAIEKNISYMPKESREEAYKKVKELKKSPCIMHAEPFRRKERNPPDIKQADCESASYKAFCKAYNDLKKYFKDNRETIKKTYIKEFSSRGINLIIQ